MIKAILFDVDGVLLNSYEANLKFFQDLMLHAGYPPPTREHYQTMFHMPMRDVVEALTQSESVDEIAKICAMGRGKDVIYDIGLLSMPTHAEIIIPSLRAHYRLGIVTGRIRTSVYEFPPLAKMKDHFSVVISYEDTTNHKPHPEPLLCAADSLEINPSECLYIGDTEIDIAAAKAASMKNILFSSNESDTADAQTTSFSELPEIIAKLSY